MTQPGLINKALAFTDREFRERLRRAELARKPAKQFWNCGYCQTVNPVSVRRGDTLFANTTCRLCRRTG